MALSEHEQRLLDQIEQALYAEDPKFVTNVRSARRQYAASPVAADQHPGVVGGPGRRTRRADAKQVAVGVIGFVLIVASCTYAAGMLSRKSRPADEPGPSKPAAGAQARQNGIRSRMEDRLRRRFDES